MATVVSEKTTARISATFVDENGAAVDLTALDVCRASIRNEDGSLVRSSDSLLDNPNAELPDDGKFVWYLTPYDTALDADTELDTTEGRTAYVRIAWDSEDSVALTNPIATTEDEREVIITHAGHGLAVRDAIFLECAADVGGLDFDSCWIVTEVINANSYKIEHHTPATSTATGGGAVTVWRKCKSAVAKLAFNVLRDDPN